MDAVISYNSLSLNWTPQNKRDHRFTVFSTIVLSVTLFAGFIMSSIEVPPQIRSSKTVVPERIAKFLTEKQKPKVIKEKPKPLPKPKLKPRIKKKPAVNRKNKPLTKALKKARKKAEMSGLLALSNELADLMDTSAVTAMVSGKTSKSITVAATVNKDALTRGIAAGSGGIKDSQYTMVAGHTKLSNKQLRNFRDSLLAGHNATDKPLKRQATKADIRLEEQVTVVFDRNKSKLYSLYNRARRHYPGLKGKIILEITITGSGKVSKVRIVVSELNNPALEKRIVARVKQFNFGLSGKESITVTFPIEFIPS